MGVKNINQITKEFGETHALKKETTSLLEDLKSDFFDAATSEVEKENLASQVVEVPDWAIADIDEYVSVWYPGWKVVAYDSGSIDGGVIDVEIEEDPEWKKFIYVNHDDSKVYQRNVIQGGPTLDDEALANNDKELWLKVTVAQEDPATKFLNQFAEWAKGDVAKPLVNKYLKERAKDLPRILRPLDDLDPDDLDALSKYLIPGSLSLRMEAPRKAKREELKA